MTRHPIVRVYSWLKSDKKLEQLLNSSKQPKIFNFEIPENYQKAEYTPLIRITQIDLRNTIYKDGDSTHYRFLFAIETFGSDINTTYTVSEYVNDIIKERDGRVIGRDLLKDKELGLFNQMNEYKIILPVKE
ncbi:hypothetical protein [Staphylococcus hominis]|uniref:hypothetical protein n=1 Tax=Staphylococcus hominis TaxID=1290 RepID=UPI002DB85AD2|nr:hypothetical protein [Staphylococcus hominis]MEB5794028.1 hypothetical protein [Staphylococcus hominis]